jgi:hypothetical protein
MKKDFEWLKILKVGDEVAIDISNNWISNAYKVCKVEKITPSGRIKLDDGSQYQPSGRKIGDSYSYPLRQITPEILEIIERRNLMDKLKFDKFKGLLSAERLRILLQWQEELIGM